MNSLEIFKSSVNTVISKSYGFFITPYVYRIYSLKKGTTKRKERKVRKGPGKGERNSAVCTIKLTLGATDDQLVGFCGLPPSPSPPPSLPRYPEKLSKPFTEQVAARSTDYKFISYDNSNSCLRFTIASHTRRAKQRKRRTANVNRRRYYSDRFEDISSNLISICC